MSEFFIDLDLDTQERFDMSKFMQWTDVDDPLTSNFLVELLNLKVHGEYRITNEELRPDLVAHRIYRDSSYWWIIMYYNNMTSLEDVTINKKITYPSLKDLESLYFTLSPKAQK